VIVLAVCDHVTGTLTLNLSKMFSSLLSDFKGLSKKTSFIEPFEPRGYCVSIMIIIMVFPIKVSKQVH